MSEWTWDARKDRQNRREHGLSLADGVPALTDPLAISRPDPRPDGDRWRLAGSAASIVVLFVAHTDLVVLPDGREVGCIISVRKAYEEGDF